MIEWTKASEELPTEDGYYIVWVARPMVAWYDSGKQVWELGKMLKVKVGSRCITHWGKINEPLKEDIYEDSVE